MKTINAKYDFLFAIWTGLFCLIFSLMCSNMYESLYGHPCDVTLFDYFFWVSYVLYTGYLAFRWWYVARDEKQTCEKLNKALNKLTPPQVMPSLYSPLQHGGRDVSCECKSPGPQINKTMKTLGLIALFMLVCAIIIGFTTLVLAYYGAILYVVIHFIHKFW